MNNQQKQQILEQIKSANNVLVTVSSNPTVDELAASVGLTLVLNKMGKHATTVFSGVVPSTIEFLQPEQTIETTTDSLRDFIIALDKSKADKLRYKVEDDVVRIFITPYKATITDKDLDFSHGDFNVDVVVALGVTRREDLDMAITAHGRILHDATVVALTARDKVSEMGAINWQEHQASSLCEMVTSIVYDMQPDIIDGQMATALLTGIIAETDRFKNEKTSPLALSLSSKLMSAGANQQLIAEKLEEPVPSPIPLDLSENERENVGESQNSDGALEIDHNDDDEDIEKIHIDEHGNLQSPPDETSFDSLPAVDGGTFQNNQNEAEQPNSAVSLKRLEEPSSQDDNQNLYNDLSQPSSESLSSVTQPNNDTPILTRGKTIEPLEDPSRTAKSDKPFDLQEALQTSGVQDNTVIAPQLPEVQAPEVLQPPTSSEISPEAVGSEFTGSVDTATPPPVAPESQAIRDEPAQVQPPPVQVPETPKVDFPPQQPTPMPQSLAELEKAVESSHVSQEQSTTEVDKSLQEAQAAVTQAAESMPPQFPVPDQAIGSQPINLDPPKPLLSQSDSNNSKNDPNAPPPVPPPMTPQFYDADGSNANPFLKPNQH